VRRLEKVEKVFWRRVGRTVGARDGGRFARSSRRLQVIRARSNKKFEKI
jgi:hypothetical protein